MKGCTIFFKVLIVALAMLPAMGGHARHDKRPNIIVILADDAGYADFGFMGSRDIRTPHLDALANDGVLFTQNYVSASVCSPSRAGLLTGKYQQRFGHECNLAPDQALAFDPAQITVAEALRQQGYRTALFGKWHLGDYEHQHPLNNGFEKFWGFISGGRSYFPDPKQDAEGTLSKILNNRTRTTFNGYLTDVIGDQAVEFIDSQKKDPFFIYLAFNAPHTPMDAKPEIIRKFEGKTSRPVYAAMMWSMDEAIGKVIKKLKDKRIYDNTLIFFLSDNGGAHGNQSSVAPLKGWKGNEFEGGIRVPMIVSWPGKIKGGATYTGMSSSLDIFSTCVAAAGADAASFKTDGMDLMPFLTSGDYRKNIHGELYWRKDKMTAARVGEYKLLKMGNEAVLYNIGNDITEQNNLVKTDSLRSNLLKAKLNQWESSLVNPLWIEPQDWNTVTEMIYDDLMNNRPVRVKAPEDLLKSNR